MNLGCDFCQYQSILEGDYNTPWYSQSWYDEPYTNFRLLEQPSKFYITTNGDNSQIWIVKEKSVGGKRFWTIDYKIQMTNITTDR
jgi:hypothetical protein